MATRGRTELLTLHPQPYPIFLVLCIVLLLLLHSTGFSIHNPPSYITSSSFCHSCRGRPNWAITISPLLILLSVRRLSSESSVLDIVSSAAKMGSSTSVPWGLAVFVGMFLLVAVLRLRRLVLLLLRLVYFTYLPFRDILFTWERKVAINTIQILLLAILLTTVFLGFN